MCVEVEWVNTVRLAPCLLMFAFLATPAKALAHDLKANHTVVPGHKILVYCWYNSITGPSAARGAEVEVTRQGRDPIKGMTDDKGLFTFGYDKAEEMTITVQQGDHRNRPPDIVLAEELERGETADSSKGSVNGSDGGVGSAEGSASNDDTSDAAARLQKSAEDSSRQLVKDLLLGVSLIFAAAAFIMSLRNARHLREIRKLLEERQTTVK